MLEPEDNELLTRVLLNEKQDLAKIWSSRLRQWILAVQEREINEVLILAPESDGVECFNEKGEDFDNILVLVTDTNSDDLFNVEAEDLERLFVADDNHVDVFEVELGRNGEWLNKRKWPKVEKP